MRKVLLFEEAVYPRALEKEFYYYCLLRQLSLSKYLITYLLYTFLHLLMIIPKKKYLELRLGFLKDVNNLEEKVNSFWQSGRKQFMNHVSVGKIVWISEYPYVLLRDIANQHKVEIVANTYDINAKAFYSFEAVEQLYEKTSLSEKTRIFANYHSKLKKMKDAEFVIVYNHKFFVTSRRFWVYKLLNLAYTFFMLLMMGLSLGLISMYFGAAYFLMPMFISYFKVENLLFLNVLPVVLIIFLLYFIFNRAWVSFLLTSIVIMGLTWINYFKLLIRNDPLLAMDVNLFFESMNMAGKYVIELDWKIISVIVACILGTAVAFYWVKGRIDFIRFRTLGIVVLVVVSLYSYKNLYANDKIYSATENYTLINRWSATQVYISKGFVYPFIYSIKAAIDEAPVGYNETAAKERLSAYNYSNIAENKKVHVISIMLEAYNDFTKFKQIEFSKDVYGYLHELEAESYSGELVTNIFAGNTVDTERSFLTGYTSLYNFRNNVNSYARYFGEQGYTVEGSHPCHDWFYNRKNINEYFGFENYYYFENYYSELANGKIADDDILFPQIIKLYEANKKTGKPYFSFNVTYQNHGPYSTEATTDVQFIKNIGYPDEEYHILNNYLAGIHHTTQELKTFIDYFRQEEEPVVIILFGDHNPWLGDNNSVYKTLGIDFDLSLDEGFYNYYNTPYLIWGNDSAKKSLNNDFKGDGPTIGPYFLMNEFFDLAGYAGNEFMKLSNQLREDVDVVHKNNRFKEFGVLTTELSSKNQKVLADFLQVQYYWRKNFRGD
ncbi:LTA synthase family protein [Anaerobacillus sp. CMMVII]|uniref:LTA synthase family protein n=1 Tax=Anaerobacillus sp. CMMVII TaxID=2755588 RepID=UPI0021B822A6|nr:LTA synthase family protein [Anaerobacillus sp. CMMVII]MCT8139923.1 LTA synthase family protein [Anaerobacillus sp. CMMVII]